MNRVSFADQIKAFAKRKGFPVAIDPILPDGPWPARNGLSESYEEYAARSGFVALHDGFGTQRAWLAEGRRLLAVGAPGTGVPCFDRDGRRLLPEVEGERDDYAGPISRGEPYGMVEKLNDWGELVLE